MQSLFPLFLETVFEDMYKVVLTVTRQYVDRTESNLYYVTSCYPRYNTSYCMMSELTYAALNYVL